MPTTAEIVSLIVSGLALIVAIVSLAHTYSARGRIVVETQTIYRGSDFIGGQLVIVNHGRRDATLLGVASQAEKGIGWTPIVPGRSVQQGVLAGNPQLPMRLGPFDAVTVFVPGTTSPHVMQVEWQVGRKKRIKTVQVSR